MTQIWFASSYTYHSLSEMSTGNLNLELWNAARDGDKDAVVAAISAGADKNWKNDSDVSDHDM